MAKHTHVYLVPKKMFGRLTTTFLPLKLFLVFCILLPECEDKAECIEINGEKKFLDNISSGYKLCPLTRKHCKGLGNVTSRRCFVCCFKSVKGTPSTTTPSPSTTTPSTITPSTTTPQSSATTNTELGLGNKQLCRVSKDGRKEFYDKFSDLFRFCHDDISHCDNLGSSTEICKLCCKKQSTHDSTQDIMPSSSTPLKMGSTTTPNSKINQLFPQDTSGGSPSQTPSKLGKRDKPTDNSYTIPIVIGIGVAIAVVGFLVYCLKCPSSWWQRYLVKRNSTANKDNAKWQSDTEMSKLSGDRG